MTRRSRTPSLFSFYPGEPLDLIELSEQRLAYRKGILQGDAIVKGEEGWKLLFLLEEVRKSDFCQMKVWITEIKLNVIEIMSVK